MSNSTQNIKEWAGDPMHPRDSTQNDEIEIDGETYVKWDTQNDWAERFERLCSNNGSCPEGCGAAVINILEMRVFIAKALADARREGGLKHYMRVSEHLRQYGRDRIMKKDERAEGFYEAIEEFERYFGLADVLATLREEES